MKNENWLIVVAGPTAVGKTNMAIQLAKNYCSEIISADGRQFYKEMESGTAKPSLEELREVKHHFVNSHSVLDSYDAGVFADDVDELLRELFIENNIVIMVGGSGLYIQSACEGFDQMPDVTPGTREELNDIFQDSGIKPLLKELEEKDPAYYVTVDKNNHQRIIRALEVIRSSGQPFSSFRNRKPVKEKEYRVLKIALRLEMEELYDRINLRMDQMIEQGLFEEAESLIEFRDLNALQTVGYREVYPYLDGEYDREEAIRLLKRNSRRYAKRQMTWFRKDEKFNWFRPDEYEKICQLINQEIAT